MGPTGGPVGPIINNRRKRSLDEDDEVEETEEYEDFDEIYDLEEIETLPIPAGLKKKKLKLLGAKIGITVNSGSLGPVPTGGSVGPIINNRRRRSLDEDDEVEETEE